MQVIKVFVFTSIVFTSGRLCAQRFVPGKQEGLSNRKQMSAHLT